MATYSAFSAAPSLSADTDSGGVNLGLEFYVTSAAWLAAIRYVQPASGGNLNTRDVGLYDLTDGSLVASGSVTPVSGDAGGWVVADLASPVSLVVDRRYRAVVFHPAGKYVATGSYFSGGDGAGGIVSGPLTVPNAVGATNGYQGSYRYAGDLANTNASFNATNYWTDVVVTDVDPTGGGSTTGAVDGSLPALTGAASGSSATSGAAVGTLAPLAGSVAGVVVTLGTLTGAAPALTGSAAGSAATSGTLAGSTPALTGAATGGTSTPTTSGAMTGTLPSLEGAATGVSRVLATLDAVLPALQGALTGSAGSTVAGQAAGTLPALQGTATGVLAASGAVAGTLPALQGAAAGLVVVSGAIAGTLPALRGVVLDAVFAEPVSDPRLVLTVPSAEVALIIPESTLGLSVPTTELELTVKGFTQNDTAPDLAGTLTSSTNAALTGATATVHIKAPDDSVISRAPTTFDPESRTWALVWQDGDLAQTGGYAVEVEITYADGRRQTFPGGKFAVQAEIA